MYNNSQHYNKYKIHMCNGVAHRKGYSSSATVIFPHVQTPQLIELHNTKITKPVTVDPTGEMCEV